MPSRMDSMISKGAAIAKGVEARMHGLVGVFKTLSEQHGEAGALLKRARANPEKRSELWPKIRQALVSHEKGELREVYPALRSHPETRMMADHHDAEAAQLSALIDRIHATPMSSEPWVEMFDQLIAMVEHHVEEEQTKIFPRAQEVLGAERAKQLEGRFLAAQQEVAITLAPS